MSRSPAAVERPHRARDAFRLAEPVRPALQRGVGAVDALERAAALGLHGRGGQQRPVGTHPQPAPVVWDRAAVLSARLRRNRARSAARGGFGPARRPRATPGPAFRCARPARGERVEQRGEDDLAVSERRPGSAGVSEQRLGHHADGRAAEHHRRRRLPAERRPSAARVPRRGCAGAARRCCQCCGRRGRSRRAARGRARTSSARTGLRSNIRSSSATRCPARSAASATRHAPTGITGAGFR